MFAEREGMVQNLVPYPEVEDGTMKAYDENELLSVKQVAAELRLTDRRIRQLINEGELPAQNPGNMGWIVRRGDLEQYKRKRETE